ncbi:MAG: pyridoxamine 5'-phosphate oxidase family protein [Elusimicrobiota bacterium]|jgi:uncharacterized pyridoxamine 5'-phosphate oxidase family protein|nr:pyridoxamine 5'-phosphate oxidase family protein [Elusimicrobiota bacterium]
MNKKIVEFIKDCGVFYLATTDGDKAKVRPFGFIDEIDGKLYFCTSVKKDVYKQLEKNPNFEIAASSKDCQEWIRVKGKAVLDSQNIAVKAKIIESSPVIKSIYKDADNKDFGIFYAKDVEAFLCFLSGKNPEPII